MSVSAQIVREIRPLFWRVQDVKEFIVEQQPENTEKVSLQMCVVKASEQERCWLLDLVDGSIESEPATFEQYMECFNQMEAVQRAKFAFKLAVWKREPSITNTTPFQEGVSYRFDNVVALHILYGGPTGSCKIRQHRSCGEHCMPIYAMGNTSEERLHNETSVNNKDAVL